MLKPCTAIYSNHQAVKTTHCFRMHSDIVTVRNWRGKVRILMVVSQWHWQLIGWSIGLHDTVIAYQISVLKKWVEIILVL